MAFTTAQKREVIQTKYPTASNIAVSGNVFFASFPDAEPIIGWLHARPGTYLLVRTAVRVTTCPELSTVPPRWFLDAAWEYAHNADDRTKWYLKTLNCARETFPSRKGARWIRISETHPFFKDSGGCSHFEISGKEKVFRGMRNGVDTVKTFPKANLLFALTEAPGPIEHRVDA